MKTRRIVVGALMAYTTLGGTRGFRLASAAPAVSEPPGPRSSDAAASEPRPFDIAAGPLEAALAMFQTQSGVDVLFRPGTDGIRALQTQGVTGRHTPEGALQALLAGTGVAFRFSGPRGVLLELRPKGEAVDVTARGTSPSSIKYTEPLREVPQTITIIPRAVIEEQGATTLRDVLQNVPGLTLAAGEGGVPAGDNLTVRGFSARNDLYVDGVRDMGPTSRDPFNLEQVEVVKGPGSAFGGRGSTGGTINLVSKSPALGRALMFSAVAGSDRTHRAAADLNEPLTGVVANAAFRVNAMVHESRVAGRDAVESRRFGLAPSLALGLGTATRLTLSYLRVEQDNVPDYGIPWVPANHNVLAAYRDAPAPVPRGAFYGLTSRDFEETTSDLATARLDRDLSRAVTLRGQVRYGASARDSVTTAPRFADPNTLDITRNAPSWITEDDVLDVQADLTARFQAAGLGHAVAAGLVYSAESNARSRYAVAGTATTTLHDPDPAAAFTGTITEARGANDLTLSADTVAAYAFDTVEAGERLELTAGVRWDHFDAAGTNAGGSAVARVDQMVSFRAGAVYKPAPHGSVYAAYGTSMNPSLEGLAYQTASTAIAPEKTRTFELGTKWDLLGERLSLSAAAFRVDKTDARTPGILPTDPAQVLEGEQRVDGLELGASGGLTRRLKVFGAYTHLRSRIVSSNTPAELGRRLINCPRHSVSLWTTYESPWKAAVGLGARFADERFGNTANTRKVDAYWLLDAMASYPLTKRLDLRLNLYNAADEYYFERLGGGHLVPGAGRSVMLSANARF